MQKTEVGFFLFKFEMFINQALGRLKTIFGAKLGSPKGDEL
jgi:hypothetical protein